MRDELYIDGLKVDMGDSGVYLKYTSNLFTELSKLSVNNSYTIKLPMTHNNQRIIEMCNVVTSTSLFPYARHVGTLVRDGVTLIGNANVYITSITDTIDICLQWHTLPSWESNKGKKLSEMEYHHKDMDYYISWNSTCLRPTYNDGLKKEDVEKHRLPVTDGEALLLLLLKSIGVTYSIDDTTRDNLRKFFLPLNNVNGSNMVGRTYQVTAQLTDKYVTYFYDKVYSYTITQFNGTSNTYVEFGEVTTPIGFKYSTIKIPEGRKEKLKAHVTADMTKYKGKESKIYVAILGGGAATTIIEPSKVVGDRCYFDEDIEMTEQGAEYFFPIVDAAPNSEINMSLTVVPNILVEYGDDIPILENLGDAKTVDIIGGLLALVNSFIVVTHINTISIVNFGDVVRSKMELDWSSKYIGMSEQGYSVDGFARSNELKYKESSIAPKSMDGSFSLPNESLEQSKTLITLPFTTVNDSGGVINHEVYKYEDGQLQIADNSDIVVGSLSIRQEDDGQNRYLSAQGTSWSELLAVYYQSYIGMLQSARVIKATMRLKPLDLVSWRADIPIYIRQLGGYFLVTEIKTKANYMADVQLIRI